MYNKFNLFIYFIKTMSTTYAFRAHFQQWPSLLEGIVAPGLRQYVEESSPEVEPDPEPPLIQELVDLDSPSPITVPRSEVVEIDSSSSSKGRIFVTLYVFFLVN